jgi:23S rRNA (adenine2503-C2)-methyltransferase
MLSLPLPQEITLLKKYESDSGAAKFVWLLKDNQIIESTYFAHYIPCTRFAYKTFLCISTMIGCPIRCRICATTFAGKFVRNLKAKEIIDEVLGTYNCIKPSIRNLISFTGIGEPLLNYKAVIKSIEYFHTKNEIFRQFQFDLDTVGIVPKIYKLAEEEFKVSLGISLHASNNYIRNKIIPINKKYTIEEILEAADYYAKSTRKKVLIHYILIKNFNDSAKNAKELVKLLRGKPFVLVLRQMNPVEGSKYTSQTSSYEDLLKFQTIIRRSGVPTFIFKRKIFDLPAAACGQLRQHFLQKKYLR